MLPLFSKKKKNLKKTLNFNIYSLHQVPCKAHWELQIPGQVMPTKMIHALSKPPVFKFKWIACNKNSCDKMSKKCVAIAIILIHEIEQANESLPHTLSIFNTLWMH